MPQGIFADKTWLLGYIAKSDADKDFATYAAMAALAGVESEEILLRDFSDEQKKLYQPRKAALQSGQEWKSKFRDLDAIKSKIKELSGWIHK